MESEANILMRIRKRFNQGPVRLFRNNQGAYKKDNYYIEYGLANPGGSDLIGWKTITITPEMVGKICCVFTAIETKRPGKKATVEQNNFINAVLAAGGFAGVATDTADVEDILSIKNLFDK